MIAFRYIVLAAIFVVGVVLTLPSDGAQTLWRNAPPIVEQQGEGLSCTTWHLDPITGITYWDGGSLESCVTNSGPCAWDADDYIRVGRSGAGSVTACGQSYGASIRAGPHLA